MPEYTCPPVAPEGYRLLPELHVETIEHALMKRIRDLDALLSPPLPPLPGDPAWDELAAQRAALVAALTAINPDLAAIWTRQVRP